MNVVEAEVVLTPLPQADGQTKIRPAIALRVMPSYDDVLVCGISTQLSSQINDFDEIISASDADFVTSGLRTTPLIRLGFLTAQPPLDIVGVIGAITPERHARLLRRLSRYLIEGLGA